MGSPHLFTRDHYWRYRHLLSLGGVHDLFVYEQNIERAGQQLRYAFNSQQGQRESHPQQFNARIVLALRAARVLTPAIDTCPAEEESSMNDHAALCVVLAGEIAPVISGLVRQQTETALRLADEVCSVNHADWSRAFATQAPETALASWMEFALRHI